MIPQQSAGGQRTRCYTFYSYKGGSGRSTTLINTAKHLIDSLHASKDKPLLIVDADLESAGLTFFFNCANKFTSYFSKAIHTSKVLNDGAKLLEGDNADMLLGTYDEEKKKIGSDVIEMLQKHFVKEKPEDIALALTDVYVFLDDYTMLSRIIESHFTFDNTIDTRRLPKNTQMIYDSYKLDDLKDQLIHITKDSTLSAKQKAAKKEEAIVDFLPARKFRDISRHFDCSPGTVRFLGADVKYEGEQFVRNGCESVIERLLQECGKRGYAAVLFDSSAGQQSTAHALHSKSDVLVYCMRPSQQFIDGTRNQLLNYGDTLDDLRQIKAEYASLGQRNKTVILLPTAVPDANDETAPLQEMSFESINNIAGTFEDLVDPTFCSMDNCLHEVALFKWREFILGVKGASKLSESMPDIAAQYANPSAMPKDAQAAYNLYNALAQRLIYNA